MTLVRVSEISPLEEAKRLLATIKSPERAAAVAKQVIALLDQMQMVQERVSATQSLRRGGTPVTYSVERSNLGETLAERRPKGSSQPFRCPRSIYDAMVTVLTHAEKPLGADEIVDGVEKLVGVRPADHQYRTVLRLWYSIDPPLIARVRARYRPVDVAAFSLAATRLWQTLKVP
jgi:hypothetical protein